MFKVGFSAIWPGKSERCSTEYVSFLRCGLCRDAAEIVEVGKCKDCIMEVLDVDDDTNTELVKKFNIAAVPSIVIDERIKVVGVPAFPWFCGDEFYRKLEDRYPFSPV